MVEHPGAGSHALLQVGAELSGWWVKPSNLEVWVEKDLGRKREKDKTLGWDGWGHYLDWKEGTGWSLDSQAALTG